MLFELYKKLRLVEGPVLAEPEHDIEPDVKGQQYMAWAQKAPKDVVNNKNFRKWFGDSRAVDDKGRPVIFYHGTSSIEHFTKFASGDLIFVSNSSKMAAMFANAWVSPTGDMPRKSKIYPVYVKVEDPFDAHDEGLADIIETPTAIDAVYNYYQEDFYEKVLGRILEKDPEYFGDAIKIPEDYKEEWSDEQELIVIDFNKLAASGDKRAVGVIWESLGDILDSDDDWKILEYGPVYRAIVKAGYDSFITHEEDAINYALFSSNQLKSVFNPGWFKDTGDVLDRKNK